jgi:hypothetical protein
MDSLTLGTPILLRYLTHAEGTVCSSCFLCLAVQHTPAVPADRSWIHQPRNCLSRRFTWRKPWPTCSCRWTSSSISVSSSAVTSVRRSAVGFRMQHTRHVRSCCSPLVFPQGIGPVRALELIRKHRSIEEILKHLDETVSEARRLASFTVDLISPLAQHTHAHTHTHTHTHLVEIRRA